MSGSYVVNEGVKGGGRSPPSSAHSYKRCLCLIATIIVFTVATIIVLLALNSGPKKGNNHQPPPHPPPADFYQQHLDRINREDEAKVTTRPPLRPTIIPQEPQRQSDPPRKTIRYWQTEEDFENEITGSPPQSPTVVQKARPITTVPPTEFHELEQVWITARPFPHNNKNHNEADNLTPTAFQEQFFHQTPQETQRTQPKRNQKLRVQDDPFTTEEYFYEEEDNNQQTHHQEDDAIYFPGQQLRRTSRLLLNHNNHNRFLSTTTVQEVPTTLPPTDVSQTPRVNRIPSRLLANPTTAPLLPSTSCPKTCDSLHCLKSLSTILMRIDFEQDPCEDFYKYACHGLQVNQVKPSSTEEKFRGQIRKYLKKDPRPEPFLQKYKTFYESCLAFKCDGATDPVVKFFRPLMNSVAPDEGLQDEKAHNLTHLIGRILLDGHLSSRVIPLFDIELEFSGTTPSPIPVITMPTSPPPLQSAHSDDIYVVNCRMEAEAVSKTETSSAKIVEAYEKCLSNNTQYIKVLEKAMRIFEIFDKLPEFEREQRLKRIITTVEWEVLDVVKRLSDTEISQELMDKNAELMSVSELSTFCPAIEWNVLFTILFDGQVDEVKVRFNERLRGICKFYQSSDFDVLQDVILSMLAHDWYVEFMRPTVIPDRQAYCERLSNGLMQDVVSNVFMSHVPLIPLHSFEKATRELFNQLKQNLIANIEAVHWMTPAEKGDVILEIDRVEIVDNYPLILKQDANVVSNMVLYMSQQDFVANVLVLRRRTRTLYRNYRSLPNPTLFANLFNPLATEVQFIPGKNVVFIPLPVVNLFVDKLDVNDLQRYEVFSRLGYMIGQALMRPVELRKLKKLMKASAENEDLKNFEDYLLTESPIRSFKGVDLELDLGSTNISMNSRFADDGSLRLTLDTYRKFAFGDVPLLTVEGSIAKTYFLSVAQQFCEAGPEKPVHEMAIGLYTKKDLPSYLRVNSMMMNSVAFKDTFSCPVGSVMNPVLKNQQFPFIDESNFNM